MNPELATDPFTVFAQWYAAAEGANVLRADAMTLATVGRDGRPSARMVLYKGVSAGGFTFFTNYNSRKARELAQNPWAALVFHWPALERQIRVEGNVARVSREESLAYFATRPRESQLGAWASEQSSVVTSRDVLDRRVAELDAEYGGREIPCPPEWGGFRLIPDRIEFWQGSVGRLHDRHVFEQGGTGWVRSRLAP